MSLIPHEKTPASSGLTDRRLLLYGAPKVGKTTFASQLHDRALFIATEPGQSALSVFKAPCRSWAEFCQLVDEIAKDDFGFRLIVVDTVDELHRQCNDHVVANLNGGTAKAFAHVSDYDYGKGYDAVAQEFRLRVAKLCSLGISVLFISHAKESVVKTRTGMELTKIGPDVGTKGSRKWLLGFVDVIAYASIIQTADGEKRVLQLQPTETAEAGARVPLEGEPLPELIPFEADAFKKAMAAATPAKEKVAA